MVVLHIMKRLSAISVFVLTIRVKIINLKLQQVFHVQHCTPVLP